MPIRLLPTEIASQIAAGEVVERPASVVKELIENALDAGASSIAIAVEGAGQRLIEISDNGCGIPPEELPLAVERHATSKLAMVEDLFKITSLGFRGEALASIGSVSHMTITSRQAGNPAGARLYVEGGKVGLVQPAGAPPGTTVRVEDLFYNVPARRKFMRNDSTERRYIDTLTMHYALAYPSVRFQLHQDSRPALQTSGSGNRREVLAALQGIETARLMLEVLSDDQDLRVRGFVSPASLTRASRREIVFFVNGRPVQDTSLSAALLRAYHTLLMVGRFPISILFLEIPPETVDVNVHPTKAEVRFREPDKIFSELQRVVRRALLAHSPVPDLDSQYTWESPRKPASQRSMDWDALEHASQIDSPRAEDSQPSTLLPPGSTNLPAVDAVQGRLSHQPANILRLVGQIAGTYLVAEGPDGLYLIDQHAAHERILFERFMAQANSLIPSQALLEPATIEFSTSKARLLNEQLPILNRLGFQVEPFGPNAFRIRSIPALLAGSDPNSALRSVVEDFEEDEAPLQAEVEARLIARVCKRAAVKAGQSLSPDEQRALIADLEACQSPRTCPHGRPTMIFLPVDLLERQFGRRGAR